MLARQAANSFSGWGSFWERSPIGCWFPTSAFWNVPGTVLEKLRTSGFKRNSSNLERARKIRDSVLSKSRNSFLVTLPSISSETCAMYSSVILGGDEFCDWLFLGYCSVSLAIAANFLLFPDVAIILEEGKISTVAKTEFFLFLKLRIT